MKDSASFRMINQTENTIIRNSVSKISSDVVSFLDSLKDFLYISFYQKSNGNLSLKIFLLNQKHKILVEEIENKDLIYEAGLYIGFIKKGNFHISLEFLEYLNKIHKISDLKQLWTSIRGEKSVLYGNNIRKEMVDKIPEGLEREDFVLILNQSNEIIAFCRSKVNRDEIDALKPKEVIAINLIDKGIYLRRKQ